MNLSSENNIKKTLMGQLVNKSLVVHSVVVNSNSVHTKLNLYIYEFWASPLRTTFYITLIKTLKKS